MKGQIKNKVFAFIAAAGVCIGIFFGFAACAGKVHVDVQKWEKGKLDKAAYTAGAYKYEVDKRDKEIARVEPISKGFVIASASSLGVATAAYALNELDKARKNKKTVVENFEQEVE